MKKQENQKKKLTKNQLRTVIVAAVSAVIAIALIITNFFVPVKYLSSYMVSGKHAPDGIMRVRFVDVGYGDCTIIELPDGKNMLIDAGNGRSSNESRILKFLNKSGIGTIDYLICTSVNAEHCGGLNEIIQYKKIKSIYLPAVENVYSTDEYRKFALAANSKGVKLITGEYGVGEANADYGYFFAFLSPSVRTNPDGEYEKFKENPSSVTARNNVSSVIWLEYAGTGFLFTSDVTDTVQNKICNFYEMAQAENDYLRIGGNRINFENCKVIKVANHGNANSVSGQLLNLTKPEVAVVSVGEHGQGCPSSEALTAASTYVGQNLFITREHGTITVQVDKEGYEIV